MESTGGFKTGKLLEEGGSIEMVEDAGKNLNKRHVSRAARRRRRKLREIQRVEESLNSGHTEVSTTALQVLPVDRSRIWPAVLQHRNSKWTDADESALTGQLGYLPGNVIRIAARVRDVSVLKQQAAETETGDDVPVVAQLYPIVWRNQHSGGKAGRKFKSRKRQRQLSQAKNTKEGDDASDDGMETEPASSTKNLSSLGMLMEPFPTTYWLTHPLLRCLVSKLELEGYGVQIEQRLAADADSLACMHRAHAAYGQERWDLLTASDIELIQARQWESAFLPTRGVAGMSNKNHGAVKCLHAHTAHYLSGSTGSSDNVIGKWVMGKVEHRWSKTVVPSCDKEKKR